MTETEFQERLAAWREKLDRRIRRLLRDHSWPEVVRELGFDSGDVLRRVLGSGG